MNKQPGFTLVELVVVIVILGVLAAVAAPKYIDMQREARIATIEALAASLKDAIRMTQVAAEIPGNLLFATGASQPFLDMNNNGAIDSDSSLDQEDILNNDGIDVMMINEHGKWMVDNHQVHKVIEIDPSLVIKTGASQHQLYIGFDTLKNGDIKAGLCRMYYDQNSVKYVTTGC
ncbi:prepilin-type N-terminal cleavage/methylation domain-containing protein [Ferrimonas senticii]|uniref:prepilin-type N-terminal cleavage/methylation domain-containing protein n=1 Tax=Ferrimonas senticii TaxID=394566 RepID=UPI00041D59FC|nr:prepilin-type N-terminal cleavage/methylation domain-containing protein [Ferrimonas senticii]